MPNKGGAAPSAWLPPQWRPDGNRQHGRQKPVIEKVTKASLTGAAGSTVEAVRHRRLASTCVADDADAADDSPMTVCRTALWTIWTLAALALCAAAGAQEVTGAGASFPAPVYAKWADAYHKATGARINYQSVGSGAGIRQIRGKTVDFGATDMPLKDADLAKDGLIQFPTVIGGVVPVVNLKGIGPGQLRLTGSLLADIYLGKVKRWNDPAIVALNPALPLPDAAIAPIRRADGAGTTFLFTNYLSKVSPAWKEKVGEGTAVKWPLGAGGKGNEGVAAFVVRLPNSIGYVEYAFAKLVRMSTVQLQNREGRFIVPDDHSFKSAAAGAQWDKSFHQILTDLPGAEAWPITGATFILMHRVLRRLRCAFSIGSTPTATRQRRR
jgi:phosphate transport system substrate-binding protein